MAKSILDGLTGSAAICLRKKSYIAQNPQPNDKIENKSQIEWRTETAAKVPVLSTKQNEMAEFNE